MNKETIKAKAKALQSFMEGHGVKLKHNVALEAIARVEGMPSYNVLQSRFDKSAPPMQPQTERMLRTWEVEVSRTGYAHALVIVKGATSHAEAARRALDEVCDDDFSLEKSSDYAIVGKEVDIDSDEGPDDEQPGEPCDWEVAVCRMAYGTQTLSISGHGLTYEEAEGLALDEAGNHYYPTDNENYVVTGAYPRKKDRQN